MRARIVQVLMAAMIGGWVGYLTGLVGGDDGSGPVTVSRCATDDQGRPVDPRGSDCLWRAPDGTWSVAHPSVYEHTPDCWTDPDGSPSHGQGLCLIQLDAGQFVLIDTNRF